MDPISRGHAILFLRRNSSSVGVILGLLFVVYLISSSGSSSVSSSDSQLRGTDANQISGSTSYSHFGGAVRKGYFNVEDSIIDASTFHLAAVADLDQKSRVENNEKGEWFSILMPGTLKKTGGEYSITWGEGRKVTTKHSEAGRGLELSELTIFDGRLLTFGDRTGIVFEFLSGDHGTSTKAVPRFILTEGDGENDKGMKIEWSTVKGGELHIGSFGKEFTNKAGEIVNKNNMWTVVIDHKGHISRYDWSANYNKVRRALNCDAPGYLVHEAVLWSETMNKWMFLPRRVSHEAYDDVKDEKLGSNLLAVASEDFKTITVVEIKLSREALADGLHGFSSFAFVPGTGDKHAVALRSVEDNCTGDDLSVCKQRSYAMVFNTVTGEVMMEEEILSDKYKFEGVEFVDIENPSLP